MVRFLPIGLLFLATAAQAQKIDSLTAQRPAPDAQTSQKPNTFPDSLAVAERHPEPGKKVGIIAQYDLANFVTVEPLLTQAAGVQATPYSGAPGALSLVRIRGAVGIAGNPQPLYLLDGVPVFQNLGTAQVPFVRSTTATPLPDGLLDLDPLLSVPTADIESITVLKGPLETARYGAQGQYGVINIRTKAGRLLAPLRVAYSGSGGVQQVRRRYDLLSARQFGELANEADIRDNQPPRYSPGELAALGAGTDWQREVLRTASTQEHHLSLSGGRATTRYYVGANYLKQNGVVLNSALQRVALRANVEQLISEHLTLAATLGLSQLTARRSVENLVLNTLTAPPTGAPYLPNGQFSRFDYYEDNPVRQALEETREPRQRQLLGRLEARYTFSPYLRASLLGQWEQNNLLQTWHLPEYQAPDTHYADQRDDNQFRQATVLAALDFSRTVADRHAFAARLEGSWQALRDEKSYVLTDNRLTSSTATYALRATLLSPAAQASYTYAGRYQLQGNFRLDKSTAQPLATAWQAAFGGQATWHLGQETFLHQLSWLNALNLWAGYGRTSNAGNFFDLCQIMPVPSPVTGFLTSPLPVLERVAQLEAGLGTQLWQRFSLQATVYQRQTTPDSPVLRAFGLAPPDYRVRNRGLELKCRRGLGRPPVAGHDQRGGGFSAKRFPCAARLSVQQPGADHHRRPAPEFVSGPALPGRGCHRPAPLPEHQRHQLSGCPAAGLGAAPLPAQPHASPWLPALGCAAASRCHAGLSALQSQPQLPRPAFGGCQQHHPRAGPLAAHPPHGQRAGGRRSRGVWHLPAPVGQPRAALVAAGQLPALGAGRAPGFGVGGRPQPAGGVGLPGLRPQREQRWRGRHRGRPRYECLPRAPHLAGGRAGQFLRPGGFLGPPQTRAAFPGLTALGAARTFSPFPLLSL